MISGSIITTADITMNETNDIGRDTGLTMHIGVDMNKLVGIGKKGSVG